MDKGVSAARGGDASANPLKRAVTVPGRYRLEFSDIATQYVNNEKGEPEQVLMLTSNFGIGDEAMKGKVKAWLLPERNRDGGEYWSESEISEADLRQFSPLALARIPRHPAMRITPYEPRITEMQPGRLVALVWAYEGSTGTHHTNQVVVSHDNGYTWSAPIDTGHAGQASSLTYLGDDLLLTIHAHRGAEPGIWVRLINFAGDRWQPLAETCIYGAGQKRQTVDGQAAAEMFKSLKFGQPSIIRLQSGDLLATHWCVEDGQGKIRSHRLRLDV